MVRGDTLLDLCLRNGKSAILVAGLREMGAEAVRKRSFPQLHARLYERARAPHTIAFISILTGRPGVYLSKDCRFSTSACTFHKNTN